MPPRRPEEFEFGSPEHVEAIKDYIRLFGRKTLGADELDRQISRLFWSSRIGASKDASVHDTIISEDAEALSYTTKLREYISSMVFVDFNGVDWADLHKRIDPLLSELQSAITAEVNSTEASRAELLSGSERTRTRQLIYEVADLWHRFGGEVGTNKLFVGFADLVTRPIRREHRDPGTIRYFAENSIRGAATEWRKLRNIKGQRGRPKKCTETDDEA